MTTFIQTRFLRIWILCSAIYIVLAVGGPNGLFPTLVWPTSSQHILQARAWLGRDIVIESENEENASRITISPRLDVTPYFRHRVVRDPREDGLVSNLAVALRLPDGSVWPVQDVWRGPAESLVDQDLRCFVGFPPGPAFLLLPLIILLGNHIATQWLGALLGGLAVASMDRLLSYWTAFFGNTCRPSANVLATLTGAGTLWIWMAPDGGIFLFSQTVAVTSLSLALLLVWEQRLWFAGLALGLAITSRPAMIGAVPLILVLVIWKDCLKPGGVDEPRNGMAEIFARLSRVAAAPLVLGLVTLLLNYLRFSSPWDFGYRFMLVPPFLRERVFEHGQLSWAYFAHNAEVVFLGLPMLVRNAAGAWVAPWLVSDPEGMGILFVTPAFLALAAAVWARTRPQVVILCVTWFALILCCLPGLLYYNTGWVQWGGRFLMDGWPMWILLAAIGLGRLPPVLARTLIVASVLCSVWAALLTMLRIWPGCCS